MVAAAVIGGIATIGGAAIASSGASKAAKAQAGAADQSTALQREIFNQQRADNEPWRKAGVTALGRLENLSTNPNSFTADPGYQWRMQQGVDAVDRSAAASGRLNSGGTQKALTRYGQGFGSNEFQNVWNRQAGLAGVGQTANAANASAGQNFANQAGANMIAAGNARASGYQSSANAWGNALGTLGGIGANAWAYRGGGDPMRGLY